MPVVADDFSPVYQGDFGAKFAPQFLYDDGTAYNLIGATITSKMQLVGEINGVIGATLGTVKTCNPSNWTIDDAINGKTHYQYQSTDVDTVGVWDIYITITISGLPVHPDGNGIVKQLVVLPAP
jgi:hypothetical protein